jgi:hypothetical protein
MNESTPKAAPAGTAWLAGVPLVVVTRFSFLGKSGWKSDASRDADLLFSPDRLRLRLALFRSITLQSLAGQTRQDFTHLILTSSQMPDWAMAELRQACGAAYGSEDRFTIVADPPGKAAVSLRRHLIASFPGAAVAQAVLDDDDGLAIDFVAELRHHLAKLEAANLKAAYLEASDTGTTQKLGPTQKLPAFVSFSSGYGFELGPSDASMWTAALYQHSYPFINCGLTLVGPPGDGKNILGIQHRKTPQLHDTALVRGKRMFLRSVHGINDSRVSRTERWQLLDPWRDTVDIRRRFPWMLDKAAPWNRG